jgi:hypothetical protein
LVSLLGWSIDPPRYCISVVWCFNTALCKAVLQIDL